MAGGVGILRPKGVVLFLAVLLLIVGGWVLLADTLARRAVEGIGTALVGARVDLDAADVGLFPPSLVLSGLAVTNPDAPMTNAVEVTRSEFSIEGRPLLTGRFVVRAARLDGVRLGTPRARSGAIKKAPKAKKESGGISIPLPELSLPDVDTILKDNPLTSVADAEALARDLKTARAAWEERLKSLPDKAAVDAYRDRIRALQKSRPKGVEEILATAKDADRLRKDMDGDLKKLRAARSDLKRDVTAYRKRVQEVAGAPAAEARRLADRYAGEGIGGVGAFFLKPAVEGMVRQGLAWYRRLEPVVERAAKHAGAATVSRPPRGRGEVVRFPERAPLPSFLIRDAAVDVTAEGGTVSGEVMNVTTEPAVLGAPLTYSFHGADLARVADVTVEGAFDRVDPAAPKDRIHLAFAGAKVARRTLAEGGPVPVTLADSTADLTVDGGREAGAIRGTLDLGLKGAHFEVGAVEGAVAKAVGDALKGVRAATIHAEVSGPPDAPRVRIRSDLDRIVGNAVKAAAGARLQALGDTLRERITERAAGPIADARAGVAGLDGVEGALAGHSDALDQLIADVKKEAGKGLKLPF
jgi:uncharacterized protein (TIGR03545 family)